MTQIVRQADDRYSLESARSRFCVSPELYLRVGSSSSSPMSSSPSPSSDQVIEDLMSGHSTGSSPTLSISLDSSSRASTIKHSTTELRVPPFEVDRTLQQDEDDDECSHHSLSRPEFTTTTSQPLKASQPTNINISTSTTTTVTSNPRVRRISRTQQRQSLSQLGYGKTESYTQLQRLGKGTYATVFMGRSRLSNELVALKEILKEHDEGAPCTAIREISLLRFLRHANIITLHDICHTPTKLTLVFEYVGPDLYTYIRQNNYLLSMHNVRLLLFQLLRGISYCHSRQVLHRDLKPQNLLVNSRGELKICDFGLARAKSIPTKSYSNEVVTLWYRPPDVLLGNTDYDTSIDMWGVGCVFFELVSGRCLFAGSSVQQQLYLIFSTLGAPTRISWPQVLQTVAYQQYNFPPFRPERLNARVPRLDSAGLALLAKFLKYAPEQRISAERAMFETFFASLPKQVYKLDERASIFDVAGVELLANPGAKLNRL